LAVELARHGFTGPLDVFDHESHYNPEGLVPEGPPSMIQSTYFKRYACCRYIHPALDAWGNLFGDADLDAEQVARIDVSTFSWALKLSNKVCPQSLVDIQFSLPFCLAIRTLLGAGALAVPSEKLLNDRRLVELAARIYLHTSPAFDARFPSETVAEVRVQTLSGAQFYSGEAVSSTPIPRSELEQKFRLAAGDRLSDDHCRKIFTALRADTLNLKGLLSLL
jgi:2-methylcitrate dehydratase PrpD